MTANRLYSQEPKKIPGLLKQIQELRFTQVMKLKNIFIREIVEGSLYSMKGSNLQTYPCLSWKMAHMAILLCILLSRM
jgi:hypothetical protein